MTSKETAVMNFQDALDLTLKALEEAKAAGGEQPYMLATFRAKMFDEELFAKSDRQLLLREVNNTLKTNYTMNAVRKANVALLHQAVGGKGHKEPTLNAVDELHGSVDVNLVQDPKGDAVDDVIAEDTLRQKVLGNDGVNEALHAFVQGLFEAGFGAKPAEERHHLYVAWTTSHGEDAFTALSDIWRAMPAATADEHFFTFLSQQLPIAWEDFKQFALLKTEEQPATPTETAQSLAQEPAAELALEQTVMPTTKAAQQDAPVSNARSAMQALHHIRLQSRQDDEQDSDKGATALPDNTTAVAGTSTTDTHSTSDEKATTMKTESLNNFINGLNVFGYKDEAARQGLLKEFLALHAQFQMPMNTQPNGIPMEEAFFNSCAINSEMEQTFTMWVIAKHPDVAAQMGTDIIKASSDKSRFSIMGTRDEGVRSSWVGAGSAIVGGLLEMSTAGNVSIGAAVGTLVGAAGAFALAEQTDKLIENQFGRYVAAGTAGLAVGALASRAGRYAEGALRGSVSALETETPVLQLPASVVLRTTPAAEAAMSALVAGL